MSETPEGTLVSLVVLSYNNAAFLREALAGAFDQDYSPLEIVLSDDASSDDSYEIMLEMAAAYDGPHSIVVTRTDKNMGVCAHLCRAVSIAQGDLIVGAAGDDVSVPWRVSTIVRHWQESGMRAMSLFSNSTMMNAFGETSGLNFMKAPAFANDLTSFKKLKRCWVTGCSHAFSRSLVDDFEPIDKRILQEDGVLAFRAILKGEIRYIDEALVRYRQHEGNTYAAKSAHKMARLMRAEKYLVRGWIADARDQLPQDPTLGRILRKAAARARVTHAIYSLPLVGTGLVAARLAAGRARGWLRGLARTTGNVRTS